MILIELNSQMLFFTKYEYFEMDLFFFFASIGQ